MDSNFWDKELEKLGFSDKDAERCKAYALDLGRGLKTIRTYPQGITVFGSARVDENSKYYKLARELGQKLAQNGHAVITGGGPGIMEAANRGAFEYGGRSIGLNIRIAHEQHPNPYLTDVLLFNYFFARKVMLAMSSKVYVFFPGGFGTMDEFSEILLLMQELKMPKMPLFLIGKSFWKDLDKFYSKKLAPLKLISPKDQKIYKITDNVDDVVKAANKIGHLKIGENEYDKFVKI